MQSHNIAEQLSHFGIQCSIGQDEEQPGILKANTQIEMLGYFHLRLLLTDSNKMVINFRNFPFSFSAHHYALMSSLLVQDKENGIDLNFLSYPNF